MAGPGTSSRSPDGADIEFKIREELQQGRVMTLPRLVARIQEKHRILESSIRPQAQTMLQRGKLVLVKNMGVTLPSIQQPTTWPPGTLMRYGTKDPGTHRGVGLVVANDGHEICVLWDGRSKDPFVTYAVEHLNSNVIYVDPGVGA